MVLELSKPLSLIIFKTRYFSYEIEKYEFPFMLVFYFLHGPIDKDNLNA